VIAVRAACTPARLGLWDHESRLGIFPVISYGERTSAILDATFGYLGHCFRGGRAATVGCFSRKLFTYMTVRATMNPMIKILPTMVSAQPTPSSKSLKAPSAE
jgi:hypothetical protein